MAEVGRHLVRMAGDLIPAVPDHLEPVSAQRQLSPAIPLDRSPAPVCGSPVQLHREPLFSPERVDAHSADPGIRFGQWKTSGLAELEETLLEHTQGPCELWHVAAKRRPQLLGSWAAEVELGVEFAEVEQSAVVGLGEGAAELARREHGAEVDEGPGHWSNAKTLGMKEDDLA